MTNKKIAGENKIEQPNEATPDNYKKSEKLENLRQYVLDEIEEKKAVKKISTEKKVKETKKASPLKEKKVKKDVSKFKSLKKEVSKKSGSNFKKWFLRFFITIIILLIVFFSVIISGVYYFKWDNKYTNTAIDYLPLPIAMVNNELILFRDFRDLSKAYLVSLARMETANKSDEAKDKIRLDALDRLIDKKIIENISKNKNIFITEEEIKIYYDTYINEAGSKENLEKIVFEMYEWNLSKFEEMILKPFILQDKLNNYFIWSKDFNQDREQKINNILTQLKNNSSQENFIELAKNSSEDASTINNGGDLGWFEKGKMVEEFENAAFNLKVGEISEVVRTIYGFHVIMIDEINEEEGKIKARHILIKARHLGDAITEEKNQTKIIKFLK
jgi:foldase protein PrsA